MERISRKHLDTAISAFERTVGVPSGTYELSSHKPGTTRLYAVEANGRRIFCEGSRPARDLYDMIHAGIRAIEERNRVRCGDMPARSA